MRNRPAPPSRVIVSVDAPGPLIVTFFAIDSSPDVSVIGPTRAGSNVIVLPMHASARSCRSVLTPLSAALWTTGSGTQVLTTCVTGLPRLLLGS